MKDFVCFIDWQKAFDRINWTKLIQILKRNGIDWCERRLFSKLYMDQRVKVCHQFSSTCTANASPTKFWIGLETATSEGKLFNL